MNVHLDLTYAAVEDFHRLEEELRQSQESGNVTTAAAQSELEQELRAQAERLTQREQELESLARNLASAERRAERFERELLDKIEQLDKSHAQLELVELENKKLSEECAAAIAARDEQVTRTGASEKTQPDRQSQPQDSPEFVSQLQSEIRRLKQTVQDFPDGWKAVLAEYENVKIDLRRLRKSEQNWEAEKLDLQEEIYRLKYGDK
jgi:chromosome segregation ATPase